MKVFHLNVDVGEAEASSLLRGNRNSECVTVETKLQIVPTNELGAIFEGLAAFTGMKQFFVKKIVSLPAQSLARVVEQQEQLDFLYLQNVSLSGEQEDFQALTEALRYHKGLRKIRFYMVRPSLRTAASLNPVISAVAAIPNLEEVTLIHCNLTDDHNGDDEDDWDGRSLLDLCGSKSLKILTLTFSTELKDQHIEQMVAALQSNKTLQNVSIRAQHLGPAAGISLGNLLNSNPKLERLRVQLSSDEHAVPIVEALHQNTNLQRLGLILPQKDNKGMREQVLGKMTDMLRKSNYNLLQMDLVGLSTNVEEIRFYLKVNQAGRKSLLAGGATRDEWVRTICNHNNDLSVMYYFLSRNPNVCLAVFRRMIVLDTPSPEMSTSTVLTAGSKRDLAKADPSETSSERKKCKVH